MKYLILLLLLFTASCGFNGKQKVETNDSKQEVIISGESYNYVVVRLEFIKEMKELCAESLLSSNYESEELYDKAVADCTFEHLSVLNTSALTSFTTDYCNLGDNTSQLTPEQLANIEAACQVLNSSIQL